MPSWTRTRIYQSSFFVIATGLIVPSIIPYTRQTCKLKNFCFANGSVLAVNKTFKHGAIYVTVTVYKNLGLIHQHTNELPVFAGHLFLHGQSDTETHSFFSHILSLEFRTTHQFVRLTVIRKRQSQKAVCCTFPLSSWWPVHATCERMPAANWMD